MLYHFELQLAGIILLTAMAASGISLWLKRRKERRENQRDDIMDDDTDMSNT